MGTRLARRALLTGSAVLGARALAACTDQTPKPDAPRSSVSPAPRPTESAPPRATPRRWLRPDDVNVETASGAVEHLATRVGPRHGTSPAYAEAADWVEQQLIRHGWSVRRQRFATPAGISWGIPLDAGKSTNLIATLRGDATAAGRSWLALGAHLDTVPQAPGGEDNASGIGVLLALAEAMPSRRTRLPVVLIAFGSEEPRGPGDDDHHFGSRAYVESLTRSQRRSLRGMVSLDRVGVGDVLPVGSPGEPDDLSRGLRRAAESIGVPTVADPFQRSSDHWSFARAGLPGARVGSTPYAGYHSAGDTAAVVDRAQLRRTARALAAWLG